VGEDFSTKEILRTAVLEGYKEYEGGVGPSVKYSLRGNISLWKSVRRIGEATAGRGSSNFR